MSENWYRIKPWAGMASIVAETFQSSTEKFLVQEGGQRIAKSSRFSEYYVSWDEAHRALLERAEDNLAKARRILERAQGFHGNVKGMKRP